MPSTRQQFNVNLDSDLVLRIKHHAVDVQLSLSDLVAHVLRDHLDGPDAVRRTVDQRTVDQPTADPAGLSLQPMVHVEDMEASVAFYEALGARVEHGSRDGDFVMMLVGTGRFALLAHPPNPEQNEGPVEMNFDAAEDLDAIEDRLRDANVTITRPATDEGFGRQLQVTAPGGLLIKINQLEPELYK